MLGVATEVEIDRLARQAAGSAEHRETLLMDGRRSVLEAVQEPVRHCGSISVQRCGLDHLSTGWPRLGDRRSSKLRLLGGAVVPSAIEQPIQLRQR